jgi:uncharacterized delta-60 repeat protein
MKIIDSLFFRKDRIVFHFILFLFTYSFELFGQINQEWIATHVTGTNRVDAQVIADPSGNVFIAGTRIDSVGNTDWLIVKYNLRGSLQWAKVYNGSSSGPDYVNAIALDEDGDLYVCGSTATSSGDDYLVRKYDQDGNLIWSKSQNGTADGDDHVFAITTDEDGNVYVTGESEGVSSSYDILTIKYNSSGTKLWSVRYNYTSNLHDAGVKIKVDDDGYVYVTGNRTGTSTSSDLVVLKYNSSGSQQWLASYNNTSNLNDFAKAIAVDTLGNVYVTGTTYNTTSNSDFVTIKYNGSGTQQWLSTYDGAGSAEDYGQSVAIDHNLNVYVSGSAEDTSGNLDLATLCYDSGGSLDWLQLYDGPASNTDIATQLMIDVSGDILVAAGSIDNSSDMDYLIISYDEGGSFQWLERFNGIADEYDQTSSLFIDELSNIYVVGSVTDTLGIYEYVTIKYNQPEENGLRLDLMLKMLAAGMTDVAKSDTVKEIVNTYGRLSADIYHHIGLSKLLEEGLDFGMDIKDEMNSKIEELFDVIPGKDHVSRIMSALHYRGSFVTPHIALAAFGEVDSIGEADEDPVIGYTFTNQTFPISCVNCTLDTIDRADRGYVPVWIVSGLPIPDAINVNYPIYKGLLNCVATNEDPSFQCEVCPITTSLGGVFYGTGPGLNHHEIEIEIGYNEIAEFDNCLYKDDYNPNDNDLLPPNHIFNINANTLQNYAQLNRIHGLPVYEPLRDELVSSIRKLEFGLKDRFFSGENGEEEGDLLTLCRYNTLFNSWNENQSQRYLLGQGGLFCITRPHTKQVPLYFAFPYARGIWYTDAPDMRIYYGTTENPPEQCASDKRKIGEENETRGCWFCVQGATALDISTSDITDYLVSTDYAFISNYWSDNVVTVGFSDGPTSLASTITDFAASIFTTPCTEYSSWDLVTSLILYDDETYEWYEIEKKFPSGKEYEVGENLLIRVRAKFNNGEAIDKCEEIELDNSDPSYLFNRITVQIRGDIKDYNSGVIHYQVDVYEEP